MSKKTEKSPKKKNTAENKNKKRHSFSFSKLIYNDKYLFALSIFLAVVVWITSSISVGSEETRTVKVEVPIKLSDQISEQLGMQYYTLQDTVEVSITVSGAKYIVGQVTENDLDIGFDTSSVSKTGDQKVPITVKNKSNTLDFSVDSVYPSAVDCYYDVDQTKTFDVNLQYDDSVVADGYVFGTPVLSEDKITVSGPKTYVDKINKLYCQVNFGDKTDLTEQFSQDCDVYIDGDGIITNYLTLTSRNDGSKVVKNISVTLPVLKVVTLPVSATFEDKPEGIDDSVFNVSYSVNNLKAGVLASADISTANIGTIDFSDLTVGTQKFDFATDSINGVAVLDNVPTVTATVTISSNYVEQVVRVSRSDITVEGAKSGENLSVTYLDDATVTVLVPRGTKITASDLSMKCDVSTRTKDNKYPVKIVVSNSSCWVYGKYVAEIK